MTYVLLGNSGVVHAGSCHAVYRANRGTEAPMTEIPSWMANSGLNMGHYTTCKGCLRNGSATAVTS